MLFREQTGLKVLSHSEEQFSNGIKKSGFAKIELVKSKIR